MPDAVVRAADQIELVDMAPEALRRRMAHGNVYPADKVDAALGNYFRVGNLTALRELALLWTADRVDEALQAYREQHDIAGTWEARERVVVAVTGGPEGETLIRRAARIAARSSGGDLLAVHVDPLRRAHRRQPGGPGPAAAAGRDPRRHLPPGRRRRRGRRRCWSSPGPRTPPSWCSAASRRSRLAALLSGPGIGSATIRESGDIDVHIVTHAQIGKGRGLPRLHGSLTLRRQARRAACWRCCSRRC